MTSVEQKRLPGDLTREQQADIPANCPHPADATNGLSQDQIVDPHLPGRILLRAGTSGWGNTHIKKRYNEGARNHETTSRAKDMWFNAWAIGYWSHPNPADDCYVAMRWNYADTQIKTMCVFFDFKNTCGLGSRGVVAAYWKSGITSCHS